MTSVVSPSVTIPVFPGVEFGRSAAGLLAARVGDKAFAMVPSHDGLHYQATERSNGRPLTS